MSAQMRSIEVPSWREWHSPLSRANVCLAEVLAELREVNYTEVKTPLIVKLVENPNYRVPGIAIFNGAVDLQAHDCIHILLGRGLLPKDEAFVIGFTMGSSNRVTTLEERLFQFISKHFYPGPYRFTEDDLTVFKKGIHLGFVSQCCPLQAVDYMAMKNLSLAQIRERLGIETDLLKAYYRQEQAMFERCEESKRLI